MKSFRTRFAPSPTGPLHLGHAFSAILAHDLARAAGGEFLLRMEDIDRSRSRPEWEELIYEDLTWLGLTWDGPVVRQSERLPAYGAALDALWGQGLLYACVCNRRDIAAAASAPNEGEPLMGPDGIVYPGTCRDRDPSRGAAPRPGNTALRLDLAAANQVSGVYTTASSESQMHRTAEFREEGDDPSHARGRVTFTPEEVREQIGDLVLARRDMGTSYHLSVVVDDADQGITHVVRGADLFDATRIHVLLQRLLGLPTPVYHHHRLIRDAAGKRLAKRDDARAIRRLRDDGARPADIRRMVGL